MEDELVEELGQLYEMLRNEFPPDAHWFCPKRQDDDPIDYDDLETEDVDEDLSPAGKLKLIEESKIRSSTAYRFCIAYGLSSHEVGEWQVFHHERLARLLTSCDKCVLNYHMGRKSFLKELSEKFEEDVVSGISDRLDNLDFERIDAGLAEAQSALQTVLKPEQQDARGLANWPAALTALYEALCCPPYHTSAVKLNWSFNSPFSLVQRNKVLRLRGILPAMTRFLFDSDPCRLRFARKAWSKYDGNLAEDTFEWVVQDALIDAIRSVSLYDAPLNEVERFWEGVLLILDKLDESLITHSLRGMEVQPDIYHLALQHISQHHSVDILDHIIRVIHILLTRSRQAFWAAYGTISPTAIVELIFGNKAFSDLLERSQNHEMEEIDIPYAVAWISSFVESLPPNQQHDACRTILCNLLEKFQVTNMPDASRLVCLRAGLDTLLTTLKTFVQNDYTINPSTSFIIINNVLSLVNNYKDTIIDCARRQPNTSDNRELSSIGFLLIRNALALDCKSLYAEFQALESGMPLHHGLDGHSESIWKAVLESFRPNDYEMAKNILIGITSLIGLEPFRQEKATDQSRKPIKDRDGNYKYVPLPRSKVRFNNDFGNLAKIIARIFERLSDFTPDNLRRLCQMPSTAFPFFAALVTPDRSTYEAAVEVMKTMTYESSRKDAISQALQSSLTLVLRSLAFATIRIRKLETFAPVPYLIKTSRDVLESLCDPQDGILRCRSSLGTEEQEAITTWWSEQWHALTTIFKQFENWSSMNSTTLMTDVCRDTMEYAETLFDQYSVLASALDSSIAEAAQALKLNKSKSSRKDLLEQPRKAMDEMVKWLRLKDPYLASTLVSLVSKVLRRLGEFDMDIEDVPEEYIKGAIKGDRATVITAQQKAELQRALEEHRGVEIIENPVNRTLTRQGTIDGFISKSTNRPEPSSRSTSVSSSLSDDVRSLPKSIDQGQSVLDLIRSRQQAKIPVGLNSKNAVKMAESIKESRRKAKDEKKKRDAEWIARADALRGVSRHVPGEGSGLKGIGVQGKDHAPAHGEMMVDSEDEESDDDCSDSKILLSKSKEKSKKVLEYEESRRRAMQQKQQGPVKKTKIIRSAKDMRARLVPPMDSLHLAILNWDIFHEGDDPPDSIDCKEVSNTFQATIHYEDTFYPLLISEAWRSLSTAKEENSSKPFEIKIVNRMSVDRFVEVSTTMAIAENRESNIMEGDIILLSKGQDPMKERQELHCLARVFKITRKRDALELSYRVSGQGGLLSAILPKVTIRGVKITSMTTIEREYASLKSLQYYDLCEEILSAKPSPILSYPDQTLNPIKSIYGVNMGQARAIWSAKENDAFTLIQGPPGSGKTKTIVAMVGALLTDKFNAPGVAINHPQGVLSRQNEALAQKKLLICAPSNAAVDELVTRLKLGIKTLKGEFHKINVIRLGRSEAINTNVKDVTLDELVRIKIEGDGKEGKAMVSERERLHQEAGRLKESITALRSQLEEARENGNSEMEHRLQREFDEKKRSQARIGAKIDADKDSGNTAARENEIIRRKLQQQIIDSAHVLCSTLSGSGHEMFKNLSVEFETVIIDEAAQCIELSALIPLKYGCSKCILVGDPKQLPPTVLSRSAARFGYEQSLFVRMQRNHPNDVHLLDTQYRMHPEISLFPSKQFYDGRLIDGENMAQIRRSPWHASSILGPYCFFDVKGTQASGSRGHSFVNIEELNVSMQLYDRLRTDYRSINFRGKVGIITPYKAQLRELRTRFQSRYGDSIFGEIEFNTTDAFQGRESEIIIFSCVRARASGGIGFLEDIRRMNVGLTRAKSSLWVLGDSRSLVQGEFWRRLIEDSKTRHRYVEGDIMSLLRKPTSKSLPSIPPTIVPEVEMSGMDDNVLISHVPNRTRQPTVDSTYSRKREGVVEGKEIGVLPSSTGVTSTITNVLEREASVPKRRREPSPSDDGRLVNKKISTELHPVASAVAPVRSVPKAKAPEVEEASNETPAAPTKPPPPHVASQGLVKPPRKKKPADPLLRSRPNRNRPR